MPPQEDRAATMARLAAAIRGNAALTEAARIVMSEWPGGEVVSGRVLSWRGGAATVELRIGFSGVGVRGPTMWVRTTLPRPRSRPDSAAPT
jgi:hypothetical protein